MKKVVIGADPFPPYQFVDENGHVFGSDYELISKAIKSMGCEGIFIIDDWKVIESKLDTHEIDIAFQVQKTPEREEKWFFSEKLRDAVTSIVSKVNRPPLNSLDEIIEAGKQLAVIEGYKYGDVIDALDPLHKVNCQSLDEILDLILKDELEYGVVDLGVFRYLQERNKSYEEIKIEANLNFNRPLYAVFLDAELCQAFNAALNHLRQ